MKKHLLSVLLAMRLVTTALAQQGKVYETRTVKSKILGTERSYSIYLPAGYDEGDGSYSVLYLLHGLGDNHMGWVQFGQAQYIVDKAIAEGKPTPMTIVTPDAGTARKGYFNLLDGTYNYEDFLFQELIPYIGKTYRVCAESRYRTISGLSIGGGGVLFYALHYSEMSIAITLLSTVRGAWTFDQMKNQSDLSEVSEEKKAEVLGRMDIQAILEKSPKEKLDRIEWIRWYIGCGDDDFLSVTNCLLYNALLQHQVSHEFRMKDGNHSWAYWWMELPEVIRFVFRILIQY